MKSNSTTTLAALALLASVLTIRAQVQITLPAPIIRETFDSVEEGKLPPGWSVANFTDSLTGGEDLDDPKSDSYLNWLVISRERVLAIGEAGRWEGPRRLMVAPNQFLNGAPVTNLVEGKFIYAESDVRGANQVQYLFSPDFNLTGKSNVFVFYNSIYEQNQDSLGAVEYSIDEAKTWLPIIYMLDTPDIARKADGSIDGFETMNRINGDTAALLDPATGEDIGRKYGAFIGVKSNLWSTLGPFISGRINDDPVESKRIELFRLQQADNQPKVRFRFAQAGTGSWYFGIDNFGLYSIEQTKPGRPTISGAATISFFGNAVFNGSAFKATAPGQTHSLSVWQVSDSASLTADKGFANVLQSITSRTGLTKFDALLGLVRPGKTYYASVQYKDQGGAASDFAEPVSFTVSGSIPQPLVFEDFESTPEGTVPKGWIVNNQTDGAGVGEDPANFRSDTYLNWSVVTYEHLAGFGAERITDTNVVSGKSIYANSDSRTGNQIQYLTTPDFNLTGKTDIWLMFKSNYMQNQDSFGGLEYSIDGGTTWRPILYMIDAPDILVKTDGTVDVLKTLTTTYGDVAKVIDPATGDRVAAGKYADFILARPLDSLGPFISGRINDDARESKRVERFRLTAADNQAKVRFRFAQAGTDSWFWGVDDFGLYSVPAAPTRSKPDAPVITPPASLTVFDTRLNFTGSAFAGIKPSDANAQTILQISATSGFSPTAGLSNAVVSVTLTNGATSVAASAGRLFPGVTYYATMQYQDQTGTKSDFAAPIQFTLAPPAAAPITLETFESTADFAVPTGWSVSNQTDTATAGANPADPKSDTYKDWVVVPFSTLVAFAGGRADNTNVVSGKSIYAESDNRGGNQIQVLRSPEYNLTGRNNIWVAFKSNYVQNQDSLGAMEYTIDGGKTWLPILYMIDDKASGGDVVRTNGVIDATASLTKTANDIAKMIDPATGQRVAAGKYSDFILAQPIGVLGPYISGRIDDDKTESRRYERFRLAAADNQAKVQFRFVQAGTGSWWWGIDDFAIYSYPSEPSLMQDLAVHLTFDADLKDTSGNNNHGTAVGSVSVGPGKIGSGALVVNSKKDGSSFNYVTLGTPDLLKFGTNTDFTVSFWANYKTWTGDPSFVSNKDWNSGGNTGFVIATHDDGRLQWNYRVTGGAARKDYDGPAGTFTGGGWHHVVVSFARNGDAKSYVDGKLVNATAIGPSTGTIESGLPVNVGQDGTGKYTDGGAVGNENALIDDVAIWRRILSDADVQKIFAAGQSGMSFDGSGGGPRLSVGRSAAGLSITWSGGGALEAADSVSGPWLPVANATSPFTVQPSGTQKFYRLRQ
jgi:hypothetical protein